MAYLSWFKFTPSDWIMGKIQRTPEITQARFMRLICLYWNKQCILSYDDAEIEIDKEHLDILLSKKIIKLENDFIIIEFLNEQLGTITETSQKRKEAVLLRWSKVKQNDTSVSKINTSVLQNDTDKIREDKIRIDNINNNIDSRKLSFAHSLKKYLDIYSKETIRDFYEYWAEPNKSNTKFRQELQKTWDTERRLKTWNKNNFNNKTQNNEQLNNITTAIRDKNPRI